MKLYDFLKERDYIYQSTDEEALKSILNGDKKITFYLGIDPTADSLHIGHFVTLMMFRFLQEAGHKGILLIGNATGMIGDPSGKSDMRKMLSSDGMEQNFEGIKKAVSRFIKFDGDNPAILVGNAEWMDKLSFVEFQRLVGVHFNVNTMLSADAYANRIKEGGLTFLEMGYMLMQSYDFVHLNEKYGCTLQIGGADQWGNIVSGSDLFRKMKNNNTISSKDEAIYGLTCPLLLTKEGKKMGKTEKGTLWVDKEKTSPYDFYQYFYNVSDDDVPMLLRRFTRTPLDEIERMCKENIIEAKKYMASSLTELVHGKDEMENVKKMVDSLFLSSQSGSSAPESEFVIQGETIGVLDLFALSGFISSKSEARRLIEQGGAAVDGEKITDVQTIVSKNGRSHVLLKKGKKGFLKVKWS